MCIVMVINSFGELATSKRTLLRSFSGKLQCQMPTISQCYSTMYSDIIGLRAENFVSSQQVGTCWHFIDNTCHSFHNQNCTE